MQIKQNTSTAIKFLLLVALILISIKYSDKILILGNQIFEVMTPLILGAVLAYILNILVTKIEHFYFPHSKHIFFNKTRRPLSIVLALLTIIGIVILIFVIVIPQLINAFKVLFDGLSDLIPTIENRIDNLSSYYPLLQNYTDQLNFNLQDLIKSTINGLTHFVTNFFNSSFLVAGTITGWFINFIIGLIFAIYILASKEKLSYQAQRIMRAYIGVDKRRKIYKVLHVAHDCFTSYITGQCLEAIILGTLCTLGMWIFGFEYASMIGTFIGATALIPIVGAYLGATLGVIMMLTISPTKALLFIIYILILQQLENNLIYPKVVGSSIGLPGIWVLVAVTIGGGLGGILGMIIGVPLTATLYKLLSMTVNQKLTTRVPSDL